MEKYIANSVDSYIAFDSHGCPVTKTALDKNEYTQKSANIENLPNDLKQYIKQDFNPDVENFCYLVINALSDEETFGDNVNGDAMPRATRHGDPLLANDTEMHGYKTYELFGHWYKNHNNKDPKNAAGFVEYASYPEDRGIVIVLVGIDRKKDPDTCFKIDRGIMPLTSMGLRVPFDLCSKCSEDHGTREIIEDWIHEWYTDPSLQKKFLQPGQFVMWHNDVYRKKHGRHIPGLAKTPKEYCDHLKYGMGKMLPDGTKYYAINMLPKFFDISSVFSNGDKLSQGLFKVAGQKINTDHMFHSEEDFNPNYNPYARDSYYDKEKKMFLFNKEAHVKKAEIEKKIPIENEPEKLTAQQLEDVLKKRLKSIKKDLGPAMQSMDESFQANPLPQEFMEQTKDRPMSQSVDAMKQMRVIPTPEEHQEVMMNSMGMGKEAAALKRMGICFDNVDIESRYMEKISRNAEAISEPIVKKDRSPENLVKLLSKVASERSFHPVFYFPRLLIHQEKQRNSIRKVANEKEFSVDMNPLFPVKKNESKKPIGHERLMNIARTKEDFKARPQLDLSEIMALAAFTYPVVRNTIAKSFSNIGKMPNMSANQAALLAVSSIAGGKLLDWMDPEQPDFAESQEASRDIMKKEASLKEYMPWSQNKLKAHMGALATMPVIHGYAMHQKRKAFRGEQLNDLERFVALNPDLLSLGYLAAGPSMARASKQYLKGAMQKTARYQEMLKEANSELRSVNFIKNNLEKIENNGEVAPKKTKYGWDDRLIGGVSWGLMSPGSFLPAFLGGMVDTEVLHRALGD